ncbi:MAG: hypothetical protein GY822_00530 [Deltaproteobacteria bacterium]|nr:hypothetical protein [Deltaproteobacteria bacterium]
MRTFLFGGLLCALFCSLFSSASQANEKSKLGVLIVFDQLRAEDVVTYAPYFPEGDFGGLMSRGAAHLDAHYQNATTTTATGHATLSTGTGPQVHGIASNGWLDENGDFVYVAAQPGELFRDGKHERGYGAVGPRHLRAPTLGDAVKAATLGKGKVVSVSIKDRAAIFTAGKGADLVMWYRKDKGVFTTSTAYPELPAWAVGPAFSLPKKGMQDGEWNILPTKVGAPKLPLDDVDGEHEEEGLSRTFPHHLKNVTDEKRARQLYVATPQSMNDVFRLAELAVENMSLGADDQPDLLIVNISTSDYVGHWFGPQSLEAVDLLRRADLRLRTFFRFLDDKVGKGQYALALSSDHGAPPLPERMQSAGLDAGRLNWHKLRTKLEKKLSTFPALPPTDDGKKRTRVAALVAPHLYVRLDDLNAKQKQDARTILRRDILAHPGVAALYDEEECQKSPITDGFQKLYCASIVPGRSGYFIIRPRPYWVFSSKDDTGISHGSGYLYSRSVPLFLMGRRIRRGRVLQPVAVEDVAVTLATMMGIPPPAASTGQVLDVFSARWRLLPSR